MGRPGDDSDRIKGHLEMMLKEFGNGKVFFRDYSLDGRNNEFSGKVVGNTLEVCLRKAEGIANTSVSHCSIISAGLL